MATTNAPTSGLGDTGIQNAPTPTMSTAETSAWQQIENTLAQYGFNPQQLTALSTWAQQEIISGNSAAQITLDLMKQPAFEQRFPALTVLGQEGVNITPAQYINLEQSYAGLEQQAGLPPDSASYDQLIAAQVSPSEYSARINQGYLAIANAPQETIAAMQDFYGVSKGQLAAYFLDPTKQEPQLLQRAMAAQIGGASATSGFQSPNTPKTAEGVSQADALRLAQMGVTYNQAQTGFQTLAHESQLYNPLPGQGQVGRQLDSTHLLNAQFGSDAQTQLQLELQAQFEKGTTSEGTNVAKTGQGATGVGQVQR